jgi:nitroreductase
MLAFQSYDYSTCPMEEFNEKRLQKILSLPKGAIPMMLQVVGMPSEYAIWSPRLRFPLDKA